MKVLVTGANGFVGSRVAELLHTHNHEVIRATRRHSPGACAVGAIDGHTDWTAALSDCDTVVHLAARVHVMKETETDSLTAFRTVNVEGTRALAQQAVRAGVRRFVFMSSVKVHGESGRFQPEDIPAPADAYGRSKLEAEYALRTIAEQEGLEVVVLRPPLVYGPGVGANFFRLMRAVDRGLPLPLACVHNSRSLIFVDNLADAVVDCLTHPDAPGHTFHVSDGEDISTPELVHRIASALGKSARLLPLPPALMHLAGQVIGRAAQVDRLLGSLTVDTTLMRQALGWNPPHSMRDGITATTTWFREATA